MTKLEYSLEDESKRLKRGCDLCSHLLCVVKEKNKMTFRTLFDSIARHRRLTVSGLLMTLFVLCAPVLTSAQYRDDDDYYRRGGRNDRYERRNDRYNNRRNQNYYGRTVREAIRRIEDNSDNFNDRIDGALDRSRVNGRRREDQILNIAKNFEETADDLNDRYGEGRNLENSRNLAQRLLDDGTRLDRFIRRQRLDNRTEQLWNQISQDLRIVADAYGYRARGGYNDDYYDRDDDYNRRGNRRAADVLGTIFGYPRN